MKLVPLGDRVVLKQVAAEETTKSGIVLPGQTKEKPQPCCKTERYLSNCKMILTVQSQAKFYKTDVKCLRF